MNIGVIYFVFLCTPKKKSLSSPSFFPHSPILAVVFCLLYSSHYTHCCGHALMNRLSYSCWRSTIVFQNGKWMTIWTREKNKSGNPRFYFGHYLWRQFHSFSSYIIKKPYFLSESLLDRDIDWKFFEISWKSSKCSAFFLSNEIITRCEMTALCRLSSKQSKTNKQTKITYIKPPEPCWIELRVRKCLNNKKSL